MSYSSRSLKTEPWARLSFTHYELEWRYKWRHSDI